MKVKVQARLSWNDLFEPTDFQGNKIYQYRATFLIEPGSESDKAIKDAIKQVATEKWKDKAPGILKGMVNNKQVCCYIEGDVTGRSENEGMMVLTSTRPKEDGRPDVRDRNASPLVEDDGKPYSGCYVMGIVDIWPQDNKFGKGVRAALAGVQFVKDGPAFKKSVKAKDDDFEDLGVEDEEDEMFS